MSSIYEQLSGTDIPASAIHLNVPMSGYTTFRVGGPADCLIDISSLSCLQSAVTFARQHALPLTIIGNGSNLLVRDGGIRGIVIRISSSYNNVESPSDTTICCESGISLSSLAQYALSHGLAGFEPLSGIPGSLGGAIIMNAGAYGAEIGQLVKNVTVLSLDNETIHTYNVDELAFGYRTSRLMHESCIILSAALTLHPDAPGQIRTRMQDFASQRRQKQPLDSPSAGSTFKRPKGAFAAKLIDDCGLRGFRTGDAQVSEKHCGFVINRGNATASDILSLMQHIQEIVQTRTGHLLEPEVRILGEDACD